MDEPIYDLFEREVWRNLAGLEVMHVDGKAIGNRIIAAHKADRLTLRKALEEAIGPDKPKVDYPKGAENDAYRYGLDEGTNQEKARMRREVARIMGETSRDANSFSESQ